MCFFVAKFAAVCYDSVDSYLLSAWTRFRKSEDLIMSFQMKHLIFPVGKSCRMTVQAQFPLRIDLQESYSVRILPFSGLRPYGLRGSTHKPTAADEAFFAENHTLTPCGEELVLELTFPQEDRYVCRIYVGEILTDTLEIYALEDDLFGKNPYKGDNHMHTRFSDGKDSPEYMAAASCSNGYDYCVITDHRVFEPSLIARDFFKPTGADFLVIPGEEVHSPDNPVHLINMGGKESVNDWWRYHEDEYRAAVEEELKTITEPMTDKDRYAAAASQVMFDRIRSVDGVSIFCHPNWIEGPVFHQHEDVTDYLFDHKRFDALELIAGGAYEIGTQMQIAYYQDLPRMPVLGNSDSHACFGGGLEPGNFTVVFADALEEEAIKNSVRNGCCVAGNENKFYGEYRLVKYAYFLQKNYFPKHRSQRAQLGAWMLRMASSGGTVNTVTDEKRKANRPSERFATLRYTEE